MSIIWADFSRKIAPVTNVKPPLIRKNRLSAIHHIHIPLVLASSALFWKKHSHCNKISQIRLMKEPMGNIFDPKSQIKKLITYPLNPKITRGELGTSPPFVLVKERPLAVDSAHVTLYLRVIHRGCTSPLRSPWLQLGVEWCVGSVSPVCKYVLTKISAKILHIDSHMHRCWPHAQML